MPYRSLQSADLQGKRVLLRAGFDVPLKDGVVQDRTRIEAMIPTINYIVDHGGSVILLSHQGRPKKNPDPEFSQKPLQPVLTELLGQDVLFSTLEQAPLATADLSPGDVILLENLRFDPREKSKNAAERQEFAQELAAYGDIYVNDAFPNCHRDHASMTGIPALLPGYMGLQLEEELNGLQPVIDAPKRPLTLIISGAKMETKVPVIERFMDIGDDILLGGCIANTFIAASGRSVGASKYEEESVETAKEILTKSQGKDVATIHIPIDIVSADEPQSDAPRSTLSTDSLGDDVKIFDMGAQTLADYVKTVEESAMVVWNGPLGLFEVDAFAAGSKQLAHALASATKKGIITIIGGGDTLELIDQTGLSAKDFTFLSTGGGAMLEFIAGKTLPALAALDQTV